MKLRYVPDVDAMEHIGGRVHPPQIAKIPAHAFADCLHDFSGRFAEMPDLRQRATRVESRLSWPSGQQRQLVLHATAWLKRPWNVSVHRPARLRTRSLSRAELEPPRCRRFLLIFWAASFVLERNTSRPRPRVTLPPISRLRSLPLYSYRHERRLALHEVALRNRASSARLRTILSPERNSG